MGGVCQKRGGGEEERLGFVRGVWHSGLVVKGGVALRNNVEGKRRAWGSLRGCGTVLVHVGRALRNSIVGKRTAWGSVAIRTGRRGTQKRHGREEESLGFVEGAWHKRQLVQGGVALRKGVGGEEERLGFLGGAWHSFREVWHSGKTWGGRRRAWDSSEGRGTQDWSFREACHSGKTWRRRRSWVCWRVGKERVTSL